MNKVKDIFKTLGLAAYYSFRLCWRHDKTDTVWRFVFTVLESFIGYFLLIITGRLMDQVQAVFEGKRESVDIDLMFAALISVMIIGVAIRRANWFFSNRFRHRMRPKNIQEIFDHQGTLDVARKRSEEYDDLEKKIEELPASWGTRYHFTEELFGMLSIVATFVLYAWTLFAKWPYLGLILTVSSIPMVISKFRIIGMWWSTSQELSPVHKLRSVIHRPFHNDRSFVQAKMFDQIPHLKKLAEANWGIILARYDKLRMQSFAGEFITGMISIGGIGIVVWLLIHQTVAGVMALGTLTVAMGAARSFRDSLAEFTGKVAEQWNSAKGVILIEKEYFGLKPLLTTEHPVYPEFDRPPGIRLDKVSFMYHGMDSLVLRNVTIDFEPGSVTAIVGRSGDGKSTLISLIARHYDPTSGTIHIGDVNARNIPPEGMANVISGMTQDTVILERKIGEEIASSRIGEPIDFKMVEESARFALFDDVVRADTQGYGSQIGVEFGGRDFSGGEKKRLALARVRYRQTPVLILDEPDSSLDPEMRRKVLDNIFTLRGKVTVIMVTHYVSITKECDKVVVIDSGEVVEQGKPDELLALGGKYSKMFREDKKQRMS